MKFGKMIAFCLALSLLFATALSLSSCGGKGDGVAKLSAGTTEVDLSEYAVVFADATTKSANLRRCFTQFAATISALSGKNVKAVTDVSAKGGEDDKEILIGLTGKAESQKAYKSIRGTGFAIRVIGNKIAIVGSDALCTFYALQYFNDLYLRDAASAKVRMHKTVAANRLKTVTLADSTACGYDFVYSASLNPYGIHPDPDLQGIYSFSGNKDYPVVAAEGFVGQLSKATSLRAGKEMKLKDDSEAPAEKEFTVGITERDATKAALERLGGGEYGFFVEEGKFVYTAWCDAALMAGTAILTDLLSLATVTVGDTTTVAFPKGFHVIGGGNDKWVTDFPKPEGEGIRLTNTLDTSDSSLQYLYTGEGVGPAAFRAYGDALRAEGYALLAENEIEESLFATFHNKGKGVLLYVAYDAYAHQSEYNYDFVYDKALRIVASPEADAPLPDTKIFAPDTDYVKVTDSSVTAIALPTASVGMGYIITLEDGSFVIFDGGHNAGSDTIWSLLCARHREIYGADPTPSNPIHVAAWIITHSHADHYAVATGLMSSYCSSNLFKLDYLIGNYPSASAIYPAMNQDVLLMGTGGFLDSFKNGTYESRFLKAHAGQRFYFANLEIEILMTYDDLNPQRQRNQNDTCTTTRLTLTSKDNPEADPFSMIWLGDANKQQSRWMCVMYGNYLKSDSVQIAHHGNIGSEIDFYALVGATVVWFPHTCEAFNTYMNGSSWWALADQYTVYKNPNSRYVYISDLYYTTLKFANGEPDYDHIYNLMSGEPIEYGVGGAALRIEH